MKYESKSRASFSPRCSALAFARFFPAPHARGDASDDEDARREFFSSGRVADAFEGGPERRLAAAGTSPGTPAPPSSRDIPNRWTTFSSVRPTMRKTHVSMPANAVKSSASGSCAEATEKCRPTVFSVRTMSAESGAARADETPGTSSRAHPAASRASSSECARDKTLGQPPLSRATTRPSRQSRTRSASMSGCFHEPDAPPRLPTYTFSASGASSTMSDAPRSSYTSTSHARSRRSARTVRLSTPPGPAPMRYTLPSPALSEPETSTVAARGIRKRRKERGTPRRRPDAHRKGRAGRATDAARMERLRRAHSAL